MPGSAPNYGFDVEILDPLDAVRDRWKAWIMATEIDGFSTYVGAPNECIKHILGSPLLEAFPSELTHRFDGLGDPINGPPN